MVIISGSLTVSEIIGVGEAARRLGAKPSDITWLFYQRELNDELCPIVGGRRVIPVEYLATIRAQLVRRGKAVTKAQAVASV